MNRPLALDEVRVWYRATESLTDADVAELSRVLSPDERARAARFVFARDRRDFTAAHALARRMLSAFGAQMPEAWRFDTRDGGKPAIAVGQASDLAFNLSHTRGLVACAVARGTDVGVDVESVGRVTDEFDIASRFFSPAECDGLQACGPDDYPGRFIDLWTLKEAYLKGTGEGLAHDLHSFSFALAGTGPIAFSAPPGRDGRWQFALAAPAPEYRLAVAVGVRAAQLPYRVVIHDAGAPDRPPLAILRSS